MSFNVLLTLALVYLSLTQGRKRILPVFLPALATLLVCLFSPVVYLRYALPLIGAVPTGLAACAARMESEEKSH